MATYFSFLFVGLSYRKLFAENTTDITQLQEVFNTSTDCFQIILGYLLYAEPYWVCRRVNILKS